MRERASGRDAGGGGRIDATGEDRARRGADQQVRVVVEARRLRRALLAAHHAASLLANDGAELGLDHRGAAVAGVDVAPALHEDKATARDGGARTGDAPKLGRGALLKVHDAVACRAQPAHDR